MATKVEQINIRMSASMDSDQAVRGTTEIHKSMESTAQSAKKAADEIKVFAQNSASAMRKASFGTRFAESTMVQLAKTGLTLGASVLTIQLRLRELRKFDLGPLSSIAANLSNSFRGASRSFEGFGNSIGKTGNSLGKFIKKLGKGKLALVAIVYVAYRVAKALVSKLINALKKASQSVTKFNSSLVSIHRSSQNAAKGLGKMGDSSERATEQMRIMESLINDLSDASGKSGEDIAGFISRLTNMGVSQREAVKATTAALNVSVNEGRDLKEVTAAITESYKGSAESAAKMGFQVKGLTKEELKRGGLVDNIQQIYGKNLETSNYILNAEVKRSKVNREIKKIKSLILRDTKNIRNLIGHIVVRASKLKKLLWELIHKVLRTIDRAWDGIFRIGSMIKIIASTTKGWIDVLLFRATPPLEKMGKIFEAIKAVQSGDWASFDKILGRKTKKALDDYADRLEGLSDEASESVQKVEVVNFASDILGMVRGFSAGLRDNDELVKLVREANPFGLSDKYTEDDDLLKAVITLANTSKVIRNKLIEILGITQRTMDLEKERARKNKASRKTVREAQPLDIGGILGAAAAINQAAAQEKYLNMLLRKSGINMNAKEVENFAKASPGHKSLQTIIRKIAQTIQGIADKAAQDAKDEEEKRKAAEAKAFRESITPVSVLNEARMRAMQREQIKEFSKITEGAGLGNWRAVLELVRDSRQGIDPLSKRIGAEAGKDVVADYVVKRLDIWLTQKADRDRRSLEFQEKMSTNLGLLGSFIGFLNQGVDATIQPKDFSKDPKEKLSQILSNINNGIEQAKIAISTGVTKAITLAVPALAPYEKQIGPIVKGIVDILEDPDSIDAFWHNFSAGVGILLEKFARGLHKMALFWPKLGMILGAAIIRSVPGIISSIIYFIPNLMSHLAVEAEKLLDLMVESLKQFIINLAYEIRNFITNAIPNAARSAGSWISDKWSGLTSWASQTASDPGAAAAGAWSRVTEAASEAGEAISKLGTEKYTIPNEKIAGAPANLEQMEFFEKLLKILESSSDGEGSRGDPFRAEINPYVIEGVTPQKISGIERTDDILTAAEAFNPYLDEGHARERQPIRIQIQIANTRLREILTDLDESGSSRVVSI